jgi:hypothetical protein
MKQIALLLISATLFINQQACNSRQQTDSQPTDSTATAATSTTSDEATVTGRLAELNLTSDSDWRGISLGDDFAKVKTTEKGEFFESDATHTGYTVEFKNLETMDVLYYQAAGKVSAINVDLYLNNRQSVTDYQKELEPYFTARYGSPKSGNGGTTWTSSNGKMVMLKDVSKGKDFGLKIKIGLSGKIAM